MAQFGVGSRNHMQLPYKATVPDQAESRAALIVAYLILYRLPCHHILVTMAIVLCLHGVEHDRRYTCLSVVDIESVVRFGMLDCRSLPWLPTPHSNSHYLRI